MNENQTFDSQALELRVLDGAQKGASAPLADGVPCVLVAGAEATDADVVLRDDRPSRLRITAAGEQALLEVLEGDVMLGARVLAAGDIAAWPIHVPLQVGATSVAFGQATWPEWPLAVAREAKPAAAAQPKPAKRSRRRSGAWIVPLVLFAALAGGGALAMVRLASPVPHEAPQAPTLAEALAGSEFAALEAGRDASGHDELHGRLATTAERTRLDGWLAEHRFAPRVNVQVDEALARDVTDVFRVNGIAVQAQVKGLGVVVAEAAEPDAERLAHAESAVQRDVRGLARLSVHNSAKPAPPPAPPVVDDPGKRIASVVPGDPAYIVTADGARYFVGAMLPTGHRITAISGHRVALERDGQTTNLNL